MKFQKLQKAVFLIFILLIIASLVLYAIFKEDFGLESLQANLENFGVWAPIAFIIFYAVATIFIPSTPFMILAGILFGFKEGLLYTIIGGFISALLVFTASRRLGKTWVEEIMQKKYFRRLDDYNKRLERSAVWDLIFMRILPVMPFNVLNILMGVSRIKTIEYLAGTLIGLVPSNLVAVYAGDALSHIF